MTSSFLALAPSFTTGLIAGSLAGLLHFASLWWNTQLLMTGGATRAGIVQLVRFAVMAVALTALAKLGAAALLGGIIGLLLARRLLLRHFGELR